MTYLEIWRQRIAENDATIDEAFIWLTNHGMDQYIAWDGLNYGV